MKPLKMNNKFAPLALRQVRWDERGLTHGERRAEAKE